MARKKNCTKALSRRRKISDSAESSAPKRIKVEIDVRSFEFQCEWQAKQFQLIRETWLINEPNICSLVVLFLDDPDYWEGQQIFQKYGTLGDPLLEPLKAAQLTKGWGRHSVKKPAFPPEFRELLRRAGTWSLGQDPWGLQLGAFSKSRKEEVFGGPEMLHEWHDETHQIVKNVQVSCATPDWLYFAHYSEYDYLFVNINSESKEFGAVRHIVNMYHCFADDEFTDAPFSNFVKLISSFAKQYAGNLEKEKDKGDFYALLYPMQCYIRGIVPFADCEAVRKIMKKLHKK